MTAILCYEVKMKFNDTLCRVIQRPLPPLRFENFQVHILDCHCSLRPAGCRIIEHEHPHYELVLVLKGGMETFCDGSRVLCTEAKGNYLFIPPATLHHRVFGSDRDNVNLNINFAVDGPEAGKLNSRLGRLAAAAGYQYPPEPGLSALLRELRRQGQLGDSGAKMMLAHLLPAFLVLFFQRNFSEVLEPGATENEFWEESFRKDRILAIKRLMVAMIGNPRPLRELSNRFGISARHLNRIFRAETGITIKEYQSKMRMIRACDLLVNSKLSISAISEALGFHRPEQFSAFFRRHTGCMPQDYRKRPQLPLPGAAGPETFMVSGGMSENH